MFDLHLAEPLAPNFAGRVDTLSLVVFGMNIPVVFVGVPRPVLVAGNPAMKPVEVWIAELAYDDQLSDAPISGQRHSLPARTTRSRFQATIP